MTKFEAIEVLTANYPDACYEQLREAVDMAIYALQAQYSKTRRICDTCKHYPSKMDKWPCADCDMREPADRWEPKETRHSTESSSTHKALDKDNGDLQSTCNQLATDTISRTAVLDLIADYDLSMGQVVRGIHALPSEQPKIIRCKECINHGKEICYFWSHFYGSINTPDDGFCYKAERRTDE